MNDKRTVEYKTSQSRNDLFVEFDCWEDNCRRWPDEEALKHYKGKVTATGYADENFFSPEGGRKTLAVCKCCKTTYQVTWHKDGTFDFERMEKK